MRVQAVAAEVHKGAAGEFVGPARIAVSGRGHEHVDLDGSKVPEFATVQQFMESTYDGMVEIVEALYDGYLRRRSCISDDPRLVSVAGKGLLREHVLAGRIAARFHGPCRALTRGL